MNRVGETGGVHYGIDAGIHDGGDSLAIVGEISSAIGRFPDAAHPVAWGTEIGDEHPMTSGLQCVDGVGANLASAASH